jgi:LacI family transcriptional regulator
MDQRVTVNVIAQKSGVSAATVSLVLNNKTGVSQETRQRVLEIAESLGYTSRSASSRSPRGSAHSPALTSLGMIVKTEADSTPQTNPFYSNVMSGIEDACRRRGIHLFFSTLPVDKDNRPVEAPAMLTGDLVDGFLLVGAFVDETITRITRRGAPPVVLVDGYSASESYDSVVSDNFRAAYQAVEYLIKKGHRDIALIGSEADAYPSLRSRRNGYLRALKENGIAETYIANFNIKNSKGLVETTRLLQENPQITAMFGINDDMAVHAMHAAQDLGKRVPEDISVIGYDDTFLAETSKPGLTTMHVGTVTMGMAAVQVLTLRLENPDSARMTLIIHPELIERESVSERK